MRRLFFGVIWLCLVCGAFAADDVRTTITIQRRGHGDKSVASTAPKTAAKDEQCSYDITVTNPSAKDTPKLTVKYVIFVEEERLGGKNKDGKIKRVSGSKEIEGFKARSQATVETQEFELTEQKLDPGFRYKSGGRRTAKDTVKGVWIKVFDGATLVGEYANPLGIKTKEAFDK